MGREVRSRFPQPVPDCSPPTLLRPLCLVWGGHSPVQGGYPELHGLLAPQSTPPRCPQQSRAAQPLGNTCSPEARRCTVTLPARLPEPASSHSSAPQLGWATPPRGPSSLWHWGVTGAPVQAHSPSPHGVKPAPKSQGHPGQPRVLRVSPCGQGSLALGTSPRRAQPCPTSPFCEPWHGMGGSAPSQNPARQVIKTLKNPTLKKKTPKLQHRPEKGRKRVSQQ